MICTFFFSPSFCSTLFFNHLFLFECNLFSLLSLFVSGATARSIHLSCMHCSLCTVYEILPSHKISLSSFMNITAVIIRQGPWPRGNPGIVKWYPKCLPPSGWPFIHTAYQFCPDRPATIRPLLLNSIQTKAYRMQYFCQKCTTHTSHIIIFI